MEQATAATINNCLSQKQSLEWKDDPLQMLAKQCDTISGDEDKIKQQIGNKRQQKNYQNGNNDFILKNNNNGHQGGGTNKGKAKSPNNKFDQSVISNNTAPFMITPNGFGISHPMQLAAAAFLHPLMPPTTQRAPFTNSNNFCPPPNNTNQFTPPTQIQLLQQFMAATAQQIPISSPQHPSSLPPNISLQQLQQNFIPPIFPPQTTPSGIPLPANMPIPATRKLDQIPPNNLFINNNNNHQNSDAEMAALAAMAMFQQQNGCSSFLNGQQSNNNNGIANNTINQQTQIDNNFLAQQLLQQPIQALLMAAACGQLPSQFACPYRLREGQACARLFASDDQLFAHYKSAHIAQISSPSAVSSTTEGGPTTAGSIPSTPSTIQTPTTTTTAATITNCRPKAAKNSPTGIPSVNQSNKNNSNYNGWNQQLFQLPPGFIPAQPFLGPPLHPPPPPPTSVAAAMIGAQNHRFHPYAQPNQGGQQTKSVHQMPPVPPQSFQQQMALALNLMANSDNSSFQQFIQNNNPPELNNAHSQLAALAAMANSLGGNNNQTQTAGSNG